MSNQNLIEKTSKIQTKAIFSKDMKKRYLLTMDFGVKGKSATIIMLYPSAADEFVIDQTTMLVRNNAVKQGYSSISIVNLFCGLDNKKPETDRTNSSVIAEVCNNADIIIVAYGRGSSHEEEKKQLLKALDVYKNKLYTIQDNSGELFSHPLSPKARNWIVDKII